MTTVPGFAAPVPAPLPGDHAGTRVDRVDSSRDVAIFFGALWIGTGLVIVLNWRLNVAIGGPALHPNEYPFELGIYVLWALLSAAAVRLALQDHSVLFHAAAAVASSYAVLFLHKLIFCALQPCCYPACITLIFSGEAWETYWILLGCFMYATTVTGTWALRSIFIARTRLMHIAEAERQLASANLQAANTRIDPRYTQELFAAISERIGTNPDAADSMITVFADLLRRDLQSIERGATFADEIDALEAWARLESLRRGTRLSIDQQAEEPLRTLRVSGGPLRLAAERLANAGDRAISLRAIRKERLLDVTLNERETVTLQIEESA